MLVSRSTDPVDPWVTADALVGWIDQNDLKVLESCILVHPVGVEHAQATTSASNTLLSDRAQRAPGLEMIDTSIARLTINLTLVHWTLAASATDTYTVDAESLLRFVS